MASRGSAAKYFDEIVSLIEGGMSQTEACASKPEYPSPRSLYNYARKTGQLKRWVRAEDNRGRSEKHFDAILRAVESGLSVSAALESNHDFPNHSSLCAYLKKNPNQRFRLDGAVQASEAIRLQTKKAEQHFEEIIDAIRNGATEFEACAGIVAVHNFRAMVDDNTAARAALDEARTERERGPHARYRALDKFTEDQYDDVLRAVGSAKGQSIRQVFAGLSSDLPGRGMVYQRVRRDPAFAARFGELSRRRNTKTSTTMGDLVAIVERHVPKHLDRTARDDIKSEIVLAVLSGEIAQKDIAKSVKQFTKRFNKKFSAWEFASLDKPFSDDSGFSLGDTITTNDEDY